MARLKPSISRGVTTVDDLRERSIVDGATHCWLWQGGCSNGKAAMWTFDHDRGEKRVMPGPRAVWNIAHGAAPLRGCMVFARCGNPMCVNPAHMREARSRAEYGAFVRRAGWLCGKALAQKADALVKARAARGIVDTPKDIVQRILEIPLDVPGTEVARRLGVKVGRVYDVRSMRTHRAYAERDARTRVSEPSHAAG